MGWFPDPTNPRHSRSMANYIPGLVLEDHLHEHVAREYLSADALCFALFDVNFLFNGDKDTEDPVFHTHSCDPLLKVRLDLILIS